MIITGDKKWQGESIFIGACREFNKRDTLNCSQEPAGGQTKRYRARDKERNAIQESDTAKEEAVKKANQQKDESQTGQKSQNQIRCKYNYHSVKMVSEYICYIADDITNANYCIVASWVLS